MGTPKGEEKEGKEVFETVTDCFPNLMSDTKPQMQEVQRTPSGVNTKTDRPHASILVLNNRKSKTEKEKQLTRGGTKTSITSSACSETTQRNEGG